MPDDLGSVLNRGKNLIQHHVQNSAGSHVASYQIDTRSFFSGYKELRVWSWHLTLILGWSKWVELYLNFPYIFIVWCLIRYSENFTFTSKALKANDHH
jgi:hypothetical protein